MRALIQTSYGPPSRSITLQTVPLPTLNPQSSDLLIRIKTASIAPSEYGFLLGYLRIFGSTFPIPTTLGLDFAGVVSAVGQQAAQEGWKEGDEVLGAVQLGKKGTYQEYVVVPAGQCARKPESVGWEEAACLPANGMTAIQPILKHEGERKAAFVTGGLGGVAHLVIQLLHHHFKFEKIYTSVSTGKVEQSKSLYPYCEVIDYKTQDPTKVIPHGSLDLVYSTIGSPGQSLPLLRPSPAKTTLIEITTSPGSAFAQANWGVQLPFYGRWILDFAGWWLRPKVREGVRWVAHNTVYVREELETVAREAGEGRLKPLIAKVFTLDQAADAFELAHEGVVGKVVFRISD